MEYRKLGNTDMFISKLSLGCSALGSVYRDVDEAEAIQTVHKAIDLGINYLDTSPYYGIFKSEAVLGKALKLIPRDQYFLATKAGRYGDTFEDFDYSYDRIIQSAEQSMLRMGVDYLDVLQLHDFEYHGGRHIKQAVEEGIPALRQLKKEGKIRYYGITAYPVDAFAHMLETVQVDVILSHNHYSLNDRQLLKIIPFLKERKIGIISAAPLSTGLLTGKGVAHWHPATQEDRAVVEKAIEKCKKHGTSIEKIAIQFSLENKDIATTLVSTASPARIINNVRYLEEAYDEELAYELIRILTPIENKDWGFSD